jgi:hypothetical protein
MTFDEVIRHTQLLRSGVHLSLALHTHAESLLLLINRIHNNYINS